MKNTNLFFLLGLFFLGACSYPQAPPSAEDLHGARGALKPGANYQVKKGDTLFGIAWRYGLDINELARWNNIADKDRIYAGQILRTTPPQGISRVKVVEPKVTSAGQSGWIWPTEGEVVQNYSATEPGKQGLRFHGKRGQAVRAASSGEIAYTGTGLSGFGRMVIIRHADHILSAYGYLDRVAVQEGQKVQKGQVIGSMGIGPSNVATLHFETRKQGKPVNPYGYIGTTKRY